MTLLLPPTGDTPRNTAQAVNQALKGKLNSVGVATLAAATSTSKETIAHAIPENSACDLPVAAVALLRAQPARQ